MFGKLVMFDKVLSENAEPAWVTLTMTITKSVMENDDYGWQGWEWEMCGIQL